MRLILGVLLCIGITCMAMEKEISEVSGITLSLSLGRAGDEVLHITLTNKGKNSIKVDRELVFFLSINLMDSEGKVLELSESDIIHKVDITDRFIDLLPNKSLERKIDYRNGFRQIISGTGVGYEGVRPIHTAYEANVSLIDPKLVSKILVRFGATRGFRESFQLLTGKESTKLSLYEGPLESSINVARKIVKPISDAESP